MSLLQGSWFCRGCSCQSHHFSSSEVQKVNAKEQTEVLQHGKCKRWQGKGLSEMLSLPSSHTAGSSLRSEGTDELQGTWVGLLRPKWNCSRLHVILNLSLIKMQFILFIRTPLNWNSSSPYEMRQYRGLSPPKWYWWGFVFSALNSTKCPALQKPAPLGLYSQRCQQGIPGLGTVAPRTSAGPELGVPGLCSAPTLCNHSYCCSRARPSLTAGGAWKAFSWLPADQPQLPGGLWAPDMEEKSLSPLASASLN